MQALAAESVTLKGSDTLIALVQRWAEVFMQREHDVEVQVTGGGTGTGVAALLNGTTDIATTSRPLSSEERAALKTRTGQAPMEWVVARDGAVFYVNTQNPISALSMAQLRALYLGRLHRWDELGGMSHAVSLYSREGSSGTYGFVKERLLENQDFAVETQTLPGNGAVIDAVAQEPWALGYGGASSIGGVKTLAILLDDGTRVLPTEEAVRDGRYPLSRELYFYTRGAPQGVVQRFIQMAISPEGQHWVRQLGCYPVSGVGQRPHPNGTFSPALRPRD